MLVAICSPVQSVIDQFLCAISMKGRYDGLNIHKISISHLYQAISHSILQWIGEY